MYKKKYGQSDFHAGVRFYQAYAKTYKSVEWADLTLLDQPNLRLLVYIKYLYKFIFSETTTIEVRQTLRVQDNNRLSKLSASVPPLDVTLRIKFPDFLELALSA